jgi:hypothetical protein
VKHILRATNNTKNFQNLTGWINDVRSIYFQDYFPGSSVEWIKSDGKVVLAHIELLINIAPF